MQPKTPISCALQFYGQTAIAGADTNAIIQEFYKQSGHSEIKGDDTPWCSAFVGAVLAELAMPTTGSLLARSWLDIGIPTDSPELGDLVILWRVSKESIFGHVGFYISEDKGMVYVLGGNQKNAVNITPFPKSQVLGYRQLTIS